MSTKDLEWLEHHLTPEVERLAKEYLLEHPEWREHPESSGKPVLDYIVEAFKGHPDLCDSILRIFLRGLLHKAVTADLDRLHRLPGESSEPPIESPRH